MQYYHYTLKKHFKCSRKGQPFYKTCLSERLKVMKISPQHPAELLPWTHPRSLYSHCVSTNLHTFVSQYLQLSNGALPSKRVDSQVRKCLHINKGISPGEALRRNHLVAWKQCSSAQTTQLLLLAALFSSDVAQLSLSSQCS